MHNTLYRLVHWYLYSSTHTRGIMSLERQTFFLGHQPFDCYIFTTTLDNGEQEIWFKGKDIANILEYQDTTQALRVNVADKWKMSWESLTTKISPQDNVEIPSNWHPKTIFIAEPGLYALITRSRKEESAIFSDWIFEDVLPSIRKRGFYAVTEQLRQQMEEEFKHREVQIRNEIALEIRNRAVSEVREQLSLEYETKLHDAREESRILLRQREDELFKRFRERVTEHEGVLQEANETIRKSVETIENQDVKICRLKSLAILRPADRRKVHQLSVFYRLLPDAFAFPHEYACSRTQKRNARRSIQTITRAPNQDRVLLYSHEREANSINVPNKIKEYIGNGRWEYVKSNVIRTSVGPEYMKRLLLRLEQR